MELPNASSSFLYRASPFLWAIGIPIGAIGALLAIKEPVYLVAMVVGIVVTVFFFRNFERTLLTLLVLRSSLDIFAAQGLTSLYAVGLDFLGLVYLTVMMLSRRKIHVDKFFYFFAGWVALQSMWVILMAVGGLGLGPSYLTSDVLPEWIRVFSFLVIYLLVMQLQENVSPQQAIDTLMYSLPFPLLVASGQIFFPSILPEFLAGTGHAYSDSGISEASRISGTFGHPNSFATFLVFFFGVTFWQLGQAKTKWPWVVLLGTIAFFIVSTKALVGLVMLTVLIIYITLSRINLVNLAVGIIVLLGTFLLFTSTEFGQERIQLFAELPYLNPDIDTSKAIILRMSTTNSFYWRVEQWTFLLEAWKKSPLLGYGFQTSKYLTHLNNSPHNDYIRALVESGIIGFVTFLSFLFSLVITNAIRAQKRLRQYIAQAKFSSILLGVVLSIMVGMITENIWSHTTLFLYIFTTMSVMGWLVNDNAIEDDEGLDSPHDAPDSLAPKLPQSGAFNQAFID